MSPQPKLLEGDVIENPTPELERLRNLTRSLTEQLNDAMRENDELRKRVSVADAPIASLREKLEPFYKLLQAVFGDIDEIDPTPSGEGESRGKVDNRVRAVWESWKSKMPGAPAEIIDALLTHTSANATQLKVICKRDIKTIYSAISRMKNAGIIEKNGGRFSLKQL